MPDTSKLHENKEKIMALIKTSGPQLPIRIAKHIGVSPLFTSAFLSEMVGEKRIKISDMKVGSSPLYYIEGQEPMLENFIEYLNFKEREAFLLLKDSKILSDEDQHPAIRVALRKIKDFAVPITVRDTETSKTKIFWKIFTLPDEEMKQRVSEKMLGKTQKKQETPFIQKESIKTDIKEEPKVKEHIQQSKEEVKTEVHEVRKQKKVKEKKPDTKFRDSIADYLSSRDIEVLQEIMVKKKEYISRIRIDIPFGKQEFYLISKEKSIITTDDLVSALQKAQSEKMPALVLATGKLHKNAQDYLKEWRNLIKFETIKL